MDDLYFLLAVVAEIRSISHFCLTSFETRNFISTVQRDVLYMFLLNFDLGFTQVLQVHLVWRPFAKKVSEDELCLSVENKLCLTIVSKQAKL
jgi:hypothetical protein